MKATLGSTLQQPAAAHCVGIDFDNTIVCHEAVFARLAEARGLSRGNPGSARRRLREVLRQAGEGELAWTRIQGETYGPGMREARPFPGAFEAIRGLLDRGCRVVVISHRTHYPAVGPAHDLHRCARAWLEQWLGDARVSAFFETTRWAKLRRIESERCTVFVDDLLEVLQDQKFPSSSHPVHFAPDIGVDSGRPDKVNHGGVTAVSTWSQMPAVVASLPVRSIEQSSEDDATAGLDGVPLAPHLCFDELVADALHTRVAGVELLSGGINNLCARLRLEDGRIIVGKRYRRSPQDPRDRFLHETHFLQLLERVGIGGVPRIVAVDKRKGLSLQTQLIGEPWPEGRTAPPGVWKQFDAFLARLQERPVRDEASRLPVAAEAGLSPQEHLAWLQHRRDLWRARSFAGQLPPETVELVKGELENEYSQVACMAIAHPEFKVRIDRSRLILTPSDFGLHNALVDESGRVSFVDFEYAGWDDPAKTEIDFRHQPRHVAGRPEHIDCLSDRLDRNSSRYLLMQKLLGLKWRYIVLAAQFSGKLPQSEVRCPEH